MQGGGFGGFSTALESLKVKHQDHNDWRVSWLRRERGQVVVPGPQLFCGDKRLWALEALDGLGCPLPRGEVLLHVLLWAGPEWWSFSVQLEAGLESALFQPLLEGYFC